MDFKAIPKVDLHCHLDGSMDIISIQNILKNMGEEYETSELVNKLCVSEDCENLAEYLQCFDLPIKCIQTRSGLSNASYDLARNAANENVKYLEVRFAPQFSREEGLSIRTILESVEAGLKRARADFDIETGIIVCAMRHHDMETNLEMLREAREMFGYGVVACDIAGNEAAFPANLYKEFFDQAKKYDMPFTIHAGECGSKENIRDSIEFGAKRLGHGIAMGDDEELMKLCASKKIGIELCPTSNLQTKIVKSLVDYPYPAMVKCGVPISVNTDNRTVSQTSSTKEIERLATQFNITEEALKKIYVDSVEMAFADDDCKHRLLQKWK